MTVFCPNCGKPNTDTANQCVSCGHELRPAGGSRAKFKGTMMMTAAAPPGGAAPGAAEPPGGPPPAAPAAGGGPTQPGSPAAKNLGFQQTMLGPMSAPPAGAPGAPAPAPAAAPGGFGSPAPAPAAGGFGNAPAPAAGGFGNAPAPAAGGFGNAPAPAAGGFGNAPAPAPPAGGFGNAPAPAAGGFGNAPAPAPPAGGFGNAPAPAAGGFGGAPAPAAGGFGAAANAAAGGFGAAANAAGTDLAAAGGAALGAAAGGFGASGAGGFGAPAPGGGGAPPGGHEPHRGPLLLGISVFGFFCCGFAAFAAFFMAKGDRQKIASGQMDPAGGQFTNIAYWLGLAGMIWFCIVVILNIVMAALGQTNVEVGSVSLGGDDLTQAEVTELVDAEVRSDALDNALMRINLTCLGDPSGEAARSNFHPGTFEALKSDACQLGNSQAAFEDATVTALAGSADESRANALGVDPASCSVFTASDAKLISCGAGVEFQVIHFENLP